MSTDATRSAQKLRHAIRLLRDARSALQDELAACGPDEVRQDPTLRRHARVADRIERFLAKHMAAGQS